MLTLNNVVVHTLTGGRISSDRGWRLVQQICRLLDLEYRKINMFVILIMKQIGMLMRW
jgi:uncharacterized protein involved in cysteine biosynthesis